MVHYASTFKAKCSREIPETGRFQAQVFTGSRSTTKKWAGQKSGRGHNWGSNNCGQLVCVMCATAKDGCDRLNGPTQTGPSEGQSAAPPPYRYRDAQTSDPHVRLAGRRFIDASELCIWLGLGVCSIGPTTIWTFKGLAATSCVCEACPGPSASRDPPRPPRLSRS